MNTQVDIHESCGHGYIASYIRSNRREESVYPLLFTNMKYTAYKGEYSGKYVKISTNSQDISEVDFSLEKVFPNIESFSFVKTMPTIEFKICKMVDSFLKLSPELFEEEYSLITEKTIGLMKDLVRSVKQIIEERGKKLDDIFSLVAPISDGSISIRLVYLSRELNIEVNSENPRTVLCLTVEEFMGNKTINDKTIVIDGISEIIGWLFNVKEIIGYPFCSGET